METAAKWLLLKEKGMKKDAIDIKTLKLNKFRGNKRDQVNIQVWCLAITRLNKVNSLGDNKRSILAVEELREEASEWSTLLAQENEVAVESWLLQEPLLIARFGKIINETHKYSLRPCSSTKTKSYETFWTLAKQHGSC
jgi:hypothetical protein